ncbi:MAG: CopG family transcriptional regulator [Candidatus Aenigmatarchaeota archaeon]|nr:MAG: CopG family transcriptional regulator [Candidatus Aenigmarchaeota archaeon]
MDKERKHFTEFTDVLVPTHIVEKIKKRIQGTEFETVSDYIAYVLREVLEETEEEEGVYSKEDEEKVKERLRALGYLD